jgi:NhaA family Na+:H+ antiporter
MRRVGIRHAVLYVIAGLALWFCTYRSGIHATIAGVALALLVPNKPAESVGGNEAEAAWLERKLHPWSSFVVVPLFALANAGIDLRGHGFAAPTAISMGIVAGLVVGKALGITAGTWLAVRTGLGRYPEGARTVHLLGVGILGGIGFTVSLFVAGLAFPGGPHLDEAKAGILVASALAAALGTAVLALAGRRRDEPEHRTGTTG